MENTANNHKLKYRFKIWYQTPLLQKVSSFMDKLDLGTQVICIEDVMTFTYTSEEKPISYFKDLIRQAMEAHGFVLYKIEGGKIE